MITVSDEASSYIKNLIEKRNIKPIGIRLSVKTNKCGLMYSIEYVDNKIEDTITIEEKGITFFIDKKSILYLYNIKIDYVNTKLQSGLVFINPNEESRCSCGKSFKCK